MQKIGNSGSGRLSEDLSCIANESSACSLLGDEYLISHGAAQSVSDCRPIMDEYCDGSDSEEIFRVKRRSSMKAEKRVSKHSAFPELSDHQVYFIRN